MHQRSHYGYNGIITGQKASRSRLVGISGYGDQKRENPVLNGTYDQSCVYLRIINNNNINNDDNNLFNLDYIYTIHYSFTLK